MTRSVLRAPSRLHFGLLSWGFEKHRQFGGIGLLIDEPGLLITAERDEEWGAEGLLAGRVIEIAVRVSERLEIRGLEAVPLRYCVLRTPSEHVGLGLGTQLGLGVARLACEQAGWHDAPVGELAALSGRGLRSGIGLHGFGLGGLVVDGGRRGPEGIPPLLARLEFPTGWSVLVVIPPSGPGLHGPGEVRAFANLPPFPEALVDRLCRLVLLGVLPAVAEADLVRFGEALEALQEGVGRGFAPAQGGAFARPESAGIVEALRAEGLVGVGQSSWGPTLYGFTDAPPERRVAILARALDRAGLPPGSALWTSASRRGASLTVEEV